MKHDQEVYDKARGEMLTDMLDYIPPGLIAEVLADEWVLSVKPGCFVNALYDALCDCRHGNFQCTEICYQVCPGNVRQDERVL